MQVKWHTRRAVSAALLLSFGFCATSCVRHPEVVIYVRAGTEIRVPVELARTEQDRTRGLMYRHDLAADAGMLFVFPETADHPFWMKNTPLPLDMIFIGEDLLVVGIVENAIPFSTRSLRVVRPSRYVLEVHAGFSARNRIAPGDRVAFSNLTAMAAQS
jgi:uncharacterized protein